MREYLKDLNQSRNFKKFVMAQKDFRYIEDKEAIFYPDKKSYKNHDKIGAKLHRGGGLSIGSMNPDCDNFEKNGFLPKEFSWVKKMVEMAEKYDKEVTKK